MSIRTKTEGGREKLRQMILEIPPPLPHSHIHSSPSERQVSGKMTILNMVRVSFHAPGKTITKLSKLPGNLMPRAGESWETFSYIWWEPGTGSKEHNMGNRGEMGRGKRWR